MQKEVRIRLGRVWMAAEDVARLDVGRTVDLGCCAEEAVEIHAGGEWIGRGAPAEMDGQFCVRVIDVAAASAPAEAASEPACPDG